MKERKPRTKEQNKFFEAKRCWYFDGINKYGNPITECNKPWSKYCDGNQHNCKHLEMKYLASLSEEEKNKYLENKK